MQTGAGVGRASLIAGPEGASNLGYFAIQTNQSGTMTESLRVNSSGNVGIGTTSPNRLLEVAGPIRISPAALPGSPAAGDLAFDSAASNTLKFYNGTAWQSINTGSGFALAGANADITSLNALTAINGASLAIGNSATTTLNVGGAATGALTSTFGANTAASVTTVQSGTGGTSITSTGIGTSAINLQINGVNGGIRLAPNGTGVVTSTRPILITPTTLPGSPVAGLVAIDSSASNTLKFYNGTAWQTVNTSTASGDFLANGSVPMTGQFRSIAGTASAPGMTFVGDTDNGFFAPAADNLAFGTAATERMRILANGNVGIGTTAPSYALDTSGSIRASTSLVAGSVGQAGQLSLFNTSGTTGATLNLVNANQNLYMGVTSDNTGYMTWYTTTGGLTTERMRLTNAGNFGIGTTSPNRLFEVAGPIRITPTVLPGSPAAGDLAFDSSGNALKFHNGTAWQTVGTSSATGDFLANGSVPMTGAFRSIAGTAAAPGMTFVGDTDNGIFAPAADNLAFGTSAAERMRILANGNVGIGTTAPAYPLDVTGVIRSTNSVNAFNFNALSSGSFAPMVSYVSTGAADAKYWDFFQNGNAFSLRAVNDAYSTSNNAITFNRSGTTITSVAIPAGNVGVGTTSPSRLLQVAGAIKITPTANPGTPTAGDIFVDSAASNALKYHNGSSWVSIGSGSGDFMANGSVPMTGSLQAIAGSATAPGINFVGDANTGIFSPAADNVAIGTSGVEQIRVLANGNVGIGVTNPTNRLEVGGDTLVTGGLTVGPIYSSNVTVMGNGTAAIPSYGFIFNAGSGMFTPGANLMAFSTNSAERLRIDANGNVGIGTTTPARRLEVAGQMRLQPSALPGSPGAGDIAIDSAASNSLKYHNGSNWVSIGSGSGDFMASGSVNMTGTFKAVAGSAAAPGMTFVGDTDTGFFSAAADSVSISAGGIERFRMLANGNIGLGTTAATARFEVRNNGNGATNPIRVGRTDNSGDDAGITYYPANALNGSNVAWSTGLVGGSARYDIGSFDGSSTSPRLSILANGNVGIGTTSPSRNLEIAGPIRVLPTALPGSPAAGDIAVDSAASNTLKYHNGSSWVSIGSGSGDFLANGSVPMTGQFRSIAGTAAAPGMTFNGDTDNGIFAPAADNLAFGTSASEKMRILANGNVGIGVTSPAAKLQVGGGIQVAGGVGMPGATHGITFAAPGDTDGGISSPADGVIAFTTNGAERFRVQGGGNVGIGNTNPTSMLSVSGKITVAQSAGTSTSGYSFIPDSDTGMFSSTDGVIDFYSNDSRAMRVNLGGNVGIGTTSPTRLLQVAGAIKITPTANPGTPTAGDMFVDSTASNALKYHNGTNWVSIGSGSGDFMANGSVPMTGQFRSIAGTAAAPGMTFDGDINTGVFAPAADQIALGTSGLERLRVLANGNVGIGNTAPNATLSLGSPTAGGTLSFNGPNGVEPQSIRIGYSSDLFGTDVSGLEFSQISGGSNRFTGIRVSGSAGRVDLSNGNIDSDWDGPSSSTVLNFKRNGNSRFSITDDVNINNVVEIRGNGSNLAFTSYGNVGIGTTAPNRRLEVAGQMRLQPSALPGSPGAGDIAIDSAASNSLKYHNGTNWVSIGAGSGDFLANGSVPMTGQFRSIAGTAAAPGLTFNGDTDNGIFAPAADNLAFGTSASEKMRILANGNVGIGTTSPVQQFEVSSSSAAVLSQFSLNNTGAAAGAGSQILFKNNLVQMASIGNVVEASTSDSSLTFGTRKTGGSPIERMRIDSSGNVGIGTSSPSRLLQVAGAMKITPTANPGTPTAGDIFVDSTASNTLKYHNGSSWVSIAAGGSGDFLANGSVSMTGNLRLNNNWLSNDGGSEGIRIGNTGNVGVGTSAGTARFLLNGNFAFPNLDNGSVSIGFEGTAPPTGSNLAISAGAGDDPGGGTGGDLTLNAGAASGAGGGTAGNLTLNAGAGTSAGSQAGNLQLFGGNALAGGGSAAGSVTIAAGMNTGGDPAGDISLQTGNTRTTRIFIAEDGNVGVGMSSPNRLLDVAGPMRLLPAPLPVSPLAGDLAFDSASSNALKFYNGIGWQTVAAGSGFAASGANADITSLNALTAINGASLAIGNSATTTLNVGGAATGALTSTFGANSGASTTTLQSGTGGTSITSTGIGTSAVNLAVNGVNGGIRLAPNGTGIVTSTRPIRITPTTLPAGPTAGLVAIDSAASNTLKYYNGSAWVSVGLTGFTSTYNTTAPNATVPISVLAASGGASDIDIALSPKGQGAFTAHAADSAIAGGDKRGINAVDLQIRRGASTQVASGQASVLVGGDSNTATGAEAAVLGGNGNTASNTRAVVLGGALSTASGLMSSVVSGSSSTASGGYASVIAGTNNTASGNYSVVAGGASNTSSGDHSFTTGYWNTSPTYAQTTVGGYSIVTGGTPNAWDPADPLFVIGNGTSDVTRSNAVTVLKNGNVAFGSSAVATGARLDIIGTTAATSSIILPRATTGNRPAVGINGMLRYNTSTARFEGYQAGSWQNLISAGGLPAADGTVGTPSINFTNSTGMGLYRIGADILGLSTAGVNRMTVDASGNVGIGTTTPLVPLHAVADTSWASGNTYAIVAGNKTTPAKRLNLGYDNTGNVGVIQSDHFGVGGMALAINPNGGNVGIGTTAPSQRLSVNGFLNVDQSDSDSGGTGSGVFHGLIFGAYSGEQIGSRRTAGGNQNGLDLYTGWFPRLSVTNSGNVGIGTTAPARLLQVAGAMKINPTANPGTPTAGDIFVDSTASNTLKYHNGSSWVSLAGGGSGDFMANGSVAMTGQLRTIAGTAANPGMTFSGDTDTGIYSDTAGQINFASDGFLRAYTNASGIYATGSTTIFNFGYEGTAYTPASASTSQVAGSIIGTQNTFGMDGGVAGLNLNARNTANNYQRASINAVAVNSGRTPVITFVQQTGATAYSERMRIDTSGNLGIGTTNPTHPLYVRRDQDAPTYITVDNQTNGASSEAGFRIESPSSMNAGFVRFSDANTSDLDLETVVYSAGGEGLSLVTGSASGDIRFLTDGWTNAFERARITSAGRFGIGTNNPSRLLQVAGAVKITPTANPGTPTAGDIFVDSTASNTLKYHNGSSWVSLAGGGSGDFMANGSVPMTGQFRGVAGTVAAPGIAFADDPGTGLVYEPSGPSLNFSVAGKSVMGVGEGSVGIGATDTSTNLLVFNSNSTTSKTPMIAVANYMGATSGGGPMLATFSSRGDITTPVDLQAGDSLGLLTFNLGTIIAGEATENWTLGASQGSAMSFHTTPNGSASPVSRMIIGQDGNVGIGLTMLPARRLQVGGAINITPTPNPGTPAAGDIFVDSTASNTLKYHNGSAWVSLVSGGSGDFLRNGTLAMTGPLQALPGTSAAPGLTYSGDTNTGIFRPLADTLAFSTAGAERLRINSTGSVGIGTTNPGDDFHVNDSVTTTDNALALFTQPNLASGGATYFILGRSATNNESGVIGYNHNTTQASRSISLSHYGQAPALYAYNNGNVSVGGATATRTFQVNGAMKLSPTANPGTPTAGDIFVDSTASNALKYHNGSAWVTVSASGGGLPAADGTVGTPSINFTNSANMGFYRISNNVLGLSTASTNRVTIDASGNVGIGTTTPSSKLHVVNTTPSTDAMIYVQNSSNTVGAQASLLLQTTHAAADPYIRFQGPFSENFYLGVDSSDSGKFKIGSTGGAPDLGSGDSMTIDNAGNVGIGTTSPTRLLHLAGAMKINPTANPGTPTAGDIFVDSSASNALKYHNGSSWVSLTGGGGTPAGITGTIQFNNASAFAANNNLFWDNTNSRLGIGMTNPATALDVAGSVRASGQVRSGPTTGNVNTVGTTNIDWNNGNVQIMTVTCGAVVFSNMLEGGTYTLVVTNTTSGTCTFSQASPDTLLNAAFAFSPANGPTTPGARSVFTFVRAGGVVYTSWTTGY